MTHLWYVVRNILLPRPKGRFVGRARVCDSAAKAHPLADQMRDYLKKRGLGDKDAVKLRLTPHTAEEAAAKLPDLWVTKNGDPMPAKPCIRIPYFDLSGKLTTFFRSRFLGPDTKNGYTGKKEQRYTQPAGTGTALYLPPLDVNWQKIAKDATKLLLITEGEFKAACATKCGHPTIGLGGVWSFRGAHGLALHPTFDEFEWKERPVVICYDSDAQFNPKVAQAEVALCRELCRLGALPEVARLPALPEFEKTGLDDLLMARGKKALEKVLDEAEDYKEARVLFELNEEVVYIKSPATGIIVRLEDLEVMRCKDFAEHAYSTRIYRKPCGFKGEQQLYKDTSAPREWLKWPQRAVAERITYAPGQERFTDKNEFNTWPDWGVKPKRGDVTLFQTLFDHLTTGLRPEEKRWALRWLAYPLQHPGAKMFSAVVFWGDQTGTGKSLLGYTMRPIYGENFKEIEEKDLHGNFNEWAANRQFVMGDEIAGGDKKRDVADEIKSLFTHPTISINEKFKPKYDVPDCINYYFTSNHSNAFFIEDTDRRFFVHDVSVQPLELKFYQDYVDWLENGGASALFYYLLHLDLGDFKPAAPPPVTAAKKGMIEIGRTSLEQWVADLKEAPQRMLVSYPIAKLWTIQQLVAEHNLTQLGEKEVDSRLMGKKLSRYFKQWKGRTPVRMLDGKNVRLWIISRDPAEIARLNKLSEPEVRGLYYEEHPVPKYATKAETDAKS
jgi:hypothetical protein